VGTPKQALEDQREAELGNHERLDRRADPGGQRLELSEIDGVRDQDAQRLAVEGHRCNVELLGELARADLHRARIEVVVEVANRRAAGPTPNDRYSARRSSVSTPISRRMVSSAPP